MEHPWSGLQGSSLKEEEEIGREGWRDLGGTLVWNGLRGLNGVKDEANFKIKMGWRITSEWIVNLIPEEW